MAGSLDGWLCMFAASTKANHDAADDDRTKDILSILASRGIHHTARSLARSLIRSADSVRSRRDEDEHKDGGLDRGRAGGLQLLSLAKMDRMAHDVC